MSSVKLVYFPVAGRAFPIRVGLGAAAAAGRVAKFDDVRLPMPEFRAKKADGSLDLPLGQLPVLEIDGASYAQSLALARYAATVGGLRPSNALEALKVDEIVATVDEAFIKAPYSAGPDDADFPNRRKAWGELLTSKYLPFFVRRLGASGGPFFLGEQLTEADLFLHALGARGIATGMYDHVPKDLFDAFPALVAHAKAVEDHPLVAAHGK